MSIFNRMQYESTFEHVKLFIPMTLKNVKFIVYHFIKINEHLKYVTQYSEESDCHTLQLRLIPYKGMEEKPEFYDL